MRTIELMLLLVNCATLILLIFARYSQNLRGRSKAVWLGSAALNLIILLLHIAIEGIRAQLFVSYIFVVVMVLAAVVVTLREPKENMKPRRKIAAVFKGVGVGFVVLLLGFTAVLASVLPVPTLPAPTGTYAVGVQYLHLVDENRDNSFFTGSTDNRELMVKIYYPAEGDAAQPFLPYFRNSRELAGAYLSEEGFPGVFFEHLVYTQTYSKENLQLAGQHSSYPVILFSHGWGYSIELYTTQCEDLASHGYIVAAIDHTFMNGAALLPGGIVGMSESPVYSGNIYPQISLDLVQITAGDAIFVINVLEELNSGERSSLFKERLNLGSLGMVGHSLGGTAAYYLAINDSRINAAINLDGVPQLIHNSNTEAAPILLITNEDNWVVCPEAVLPKLEDLPRDYSALMLESFGSEAAYEENKQRTLEAILEFSDILARTQTLFLIEGSQHSAFSDLGFVLGKPLDQLFGVGTTKAATSLEITQALTLAFFDQHLKGRSENSLDTIVENYAELHRVDL
ncbi:MAG: hypothetical protein FWE41_05615 [Coriobacteriia bacterium]|nr:hypothetical protein [Coriobacteriia bacterium]MCL2749437.1 hypothetical protein [Coriobacteriia bacterium]